MNQPHGRHGKFQNVLHCLGAFAGAGRTRDSILQEILDELPEIMQRELNNMWAGQDGPSRI